ncbi:MAG: DUF2815 family protein [Dysosmobacter welbionis]
MAMSNTTVTTNEVRFSYLHVFQPFANQQGQEPKYSLTILIPKTDTATKAAIDAAVNAAITAGVSAKWGGVRPPQPPICVHDGDGGRPTDGAPYGSECKGHWVITASSNQQHPPFVVDANMQPIINQADVYSGAYGRASITFYAYNSGNKKGIGCGLNGIQMLRGGEPLSGSTITAAEAFGTPAAAPAAPTTPYYGAAMPATPGQVTYNNTGYAVQQQGAANVNPLTGQPLPF